MNASGRNPSIRPRSSIKESPYRLFSFLPFIPPCCDHTHIYNLHILFKDTSFPLFMLFLTTGTYQYYFSIYVEWVQVLHLSFNKGKYCILYFDTFKISVQNYNIEHCKYNFYFWDLQVVPYNIIKNFCECLISWYGNKPCPILSKVG